MIRQLGKNNKMAEEFDVSIKVNDAVSRSQTLIKMKKSNYTQSLVKRKFTHKKQQTLHIPFLEISAGRLDR